MQETKNNIEHIINIVRKLVKIALLIFVLVILAGVFLTLFPPWILFPKPSFPVLTEVNKLTASDATAGDNFGYSVAVSGTRVVVGAPYDGLNDSGAAYVYDCSSLPCSEVTKLRASNPGQEDNFGYSVAVSGTTVAVGAIGKLARFAAVYVYDCSGAYCMEVSKLMSSTFNMSAYKFGQSVAVDGTTIVVGAYGSAFVYDCSSFPCTEVSKLTASDEYFGWSVAVDGTTVVVGAPVVNYWSGMPLVYDRSGESRKSMVSNTASADGTTVLVDTLMVRDHALDEVVYSGVAYVYDCSGTSCTEVSKLIRPISLEDQWFGASVAVGGTTVAVGSPFTVHPQLTGFGRAYAYECNDISCMYMNELEAVDRRWGVTTGYPYGPTYRYFGRSLTIDGSSLVIGTIREDSGRVADVYNCDGSCTKTYELRASDDDWSSRSVAVSGTTVVVGAPYNSTGYLEEAGSVYVFDIPPVP